MVTDILLIEDNIELARLLQDFLEREALTVRHEADAENGLVFLAGHTVRLILLDVMLPGMDGFELCSRLRRTANTPVLLISARIAKEDKIAGLDLGADDYIEKPFDVDVLLAKVRSQLRRSSREAADVAKTVAEAEQLAQQGGIILDTDKRKVYRNGEEYHLPGKEYDLLEMFLQNPGKTLRKEWIFNKVWGMESFSEPATLNVYINKLREKLEDSPKEPKRIVTVWGVGYRYEEF